MLKNVLIVVDDIEKSIEFYRDLFGLQVILKNEGNVILSEGLVLQDADVWGKTLNESRIIGLFKIMRYFYFKDKVAFNADLTFIHPFKNHKNTSFLFLLDYIANIRYIH